MSIVMAGSPPTGHSRSGPPGPLIQHFHNHARSLPHANIINGQYRYMNDLQRLQVTSATDLCHSWPTYHTPIHIDRLAPFLESHPDRSFAAYIHKGLSTGFRVGFNQLSTQLQSRSTNHPSARQQGEVVRERILAEVSAGRLLGPLSGDAVHHVHVSPMGLVPKAQTNKWRLIVDLSSPAGHSVNDGIDPILCSLRYASVDEAVAEVKKLGRDTQLVKLDIKDAYRIVLVHPADYHLLGIRWQGGVYVDRALPFGLRSAPKIFNAVADFIAWALNCRGITCQMHYLDDFLFLGAPSTNQGAHFLTLAMETLQWLGVPVAAHKTEGPATTLVFLGILLDTHAFELRLPTDKLARLKILIQCWASKRVCTRKELESLLGHLSHAATVITQGRTFLRQLFPLLSQGRAAHHRIRLNVGARADLIWWQTFLQTWNGTSFFPSPAPSTDVISDASGTFGCGAFTLGLGWFQHEWPESWRTVNITAKELLPIVIAASLWGHHWKRCCIRFRSDNMAVVHLLRSRTSPDVLLMHLLRCMSFYAAYYGFTFVSEHIPGVLNTAADAISRNNIPLFLSLVPQVARVVIPQATVELLVTKRPDWGSRDWTRLFRRSLIEESPSQLTQYTNQEGGNT